MKVAVIGTGQMGENHVRVYSSMDNVDLVGVADANKERAGQIAKKYNTKAYSDYKQMLAKEKIDALSVCVPTKMHKEVVLAALDKKINVLVEKPIALNVAEAEGMLRKAKEKKVRLMVGHIERFNPVVTELKKRIAANELGQIYKVHCFRMGPFPKRIIDVGVIIDLGIHEVDILRHIIGSKIIRVYAETAQRIHSNHEDLLTATVRFENGILGVINANWLTPKKVREISVTGEKGMFVANYITQELNFYENEFFRQNSNSSMSGMNVMEGRKINIQVPFEEPLRKELSAFIECVESKSKEPVSGQDGLEALKIVSKLMESAKKNEVIDV